MRVFKAMSVRVHARSHAAQADRGAMLVIAIIIITVIAVVTGALLSRGWVNLRSTVALRGVAGTAYSGDAAAKVAINNLRLGSRSPDWITPGFNGMWASPTGWVFTNNSDGTGCFGATGTTPLNNLELKDLYPPTGDQSLATSARVECSPVPGTGILSAGGGVTIQDPDATDPFAQALTTLGTASDPHDGAYLDVKGSGNDNSAPIGGGIQSKSFVKVDHGDLTTDGYVWANGQCSDGSGTFGSGRVVSSDTRCPKAGGITTPEVPPSPLTAVPTLRDPLAVTDCNFQEGSYISGEDLTNAVKACNTPARPVAYFEPGKYYFDFQDDQPWIMQSTIVGGVPTGSAIPGACQSPIKFPSTAGVQFVFGASSRIEVENSASVELCGPANSGKAPLTIFQQQTNGPSIVVTEPPEPPIITPGVLGPAVGTSGATLADKNQGNPKVRAFVVDGAAPTGVANTLAGSLSAASDSFGAKWTSGGNGYTGQLTVDGFGSVPAGASITSASVNIVYGTAPPANAVPSVSMSGVPLGSSPSSGSINLTAPQVVLLQAAAGSGALNPSVQMSVAPSGNGSPTFTVDKIEVTVNYTTSSAPAPPDTVTVAIRKATNTTFIQTKTNSKARFVVQGATYAPQGYLDMEPGNDPGTLISFRWGVVAQAVYFNAQPQQLFGYPLVSVPVAGQGLGSRATAVDLKVHICVSSGICASGGSHRLTVRVLITDPPYNNDGPYAGTPEPGRRQIKILSWGK